MIPISFSRDGLPIFYHDDSKDLQYKDEKIPYRILKFAYDSPRDRIIIKPNLTMVKSKGFIQLGCLIIDKINCEQIIKKCEK